jgi:hypothetical protein
MAKIEMAEGFPFDLCLRKRNNRDFTVWACNERARDVVNDICGQGIEWQAQEPGSGWLTRMRPPSQIVLLATEAIKRGLVVGRMSKDYQTADQYVLGDDGIATLKQPEAIYIAIARKADGWYWAQTSLPGPPSPSNPIIMSGGPFADQESAEKDAEQNLLPPGDVTAATVH